MPSITFGRWNPTEVMERRLDGDWPNPTPFATNLVIPTSIVSTGAGNSSSIGTNGSVTFSSCATLSLNGVFTSDFDNYMIVMRHVSSVPYPTITFRYRTAGTDASGANYTTQTLSADSTTRTAIRTSSNTSGNLFSSSDAVRSGSVGYVYGPYLSQPTASRGVTGAGDGNAWIIDYAATHSLSTAYDGISFIMSSGTISGLVAVYGLGV